MPRHARPIDPGPSAVLDLTGLTVTELACLSTGMREAQVACEAAYEQFDQDGLSYIKSRYGSPGVADMWRDLVALRIEVRTAFVREFLRV